MYLAKKRRLNADYLQATFKTNQEKLDKLKSLLENANLTNKLGREEFFSQIGPVINDSSMKSVNLRALVGAEKIERLLFDVVDYFNQRPAFCPGERFIEYVAESGYKDKPDVNESGNEASSLRRTTPVHRAAKLQRSIEVMRNLFKIYNNFEANYVDEDGLTHFHAACMYDCYFEVETFLQLDQQNKLLGLLTKTGDAPLHLAIENQWIALMELLLRCGAEPNLGNAEGSTALHLICKINRLDERDGLVERLFEVCGDGVRVDARDNAGRTPLHCAMRSGSAKKVRLLLSRGADPNSIDDEGSTPLHLCFENHAKMLTDTFFLYGKDVRVDARDKRGRTPLQLAVAHLLPDALYALLNNGADMSGFVFPDEADFEETVEWRKSYRSQSENYPPEVKVIFDGLGVVRHLENRKYELAPSDAMKIMKAFAEHGSLEKSARVTCPNDEHDRIDVAVYSSLKKIKLSHGLTFHDVILMPIAEAAKLFTYTNFMITTRMFGGSDSPISQAIDIRMAAILLRGFLWPWAVAAHAGLTRNRLPLECYEMIIDESFTNQELYNVCVAATLPE